MTYDIHIINDVHVITPKKHLVGGDETEELKAAVAQLAASGAPRVIVDLSKISWVSSLGLCGLMRAKMSCDDCQGWLRLACIGQRIDDILVVTRLERYFDAFDTVEDAVAATIGHA